MKVAQSTTFHMLTHYRSYQWDFQAVKIIQNSEQMWAPHWTAQLLIRY